MKVGSTRQTFWRGLAQNNQATQTEAQELSVLLDRLEADRGVHLEFKPEGFLRKLVAGADSHVTGSEFAQRVVGNAGKFPSGLWIQTETGSQRVTHFESLREILVHHEVEPVEASRNPLLAHNLRVAAAHGVKFPSSAPHVMFEELSGSDYWCFTHEGEEQSLYGADGLGAFLQEHGAAEARVSKPELLDELRQLREAGYELQHYDEPLEIWHSYPNVLDHRFHHRDWLCYRGQKVAELYQVRDFHEVLDSWRARNGTLNKHSQQLIAGESRLPLDRLAAIEQAGVDFNTHLARYQHLLDSSSGQADVGVYEELVELDLDLSMDDRLGLAGRLMSSGHSKELPAVWESAGKEANPELTLETADVITEFLAAERSRDEALSTLDMARALLPEMPTAERTELLHRLVDHCRSGRLTRHLQALSSLVSRADSSVVGAYLGLCNAKGEEADQVPELVPGLLKTVAPEKLAAKLEEMGKALLFDSTEARPVDIEMGEDYLDIEGQVLAVRD